MDLLTFTLNGPTSGRQRPLVVIYDDEGIPEEIDFRATIASLRGVAETTPILLEERYIQQQDGLGLLLRLRMEPSLRAGRCPVFVRLRNPLEKHLRRHGKFAVLCTEGVALLGPDDEPDPASTPSPLYADEKGDPLLHVLEALPIQPEGDGSRHDLANRWGPLRLWKGLQRLRPKDEVRPNPKWVTELDQELRNEEPYAYLLALAELRISGKAGASSDPGDAYAEWKKFLSEHRGAELRVLLLDDEIERGWGEAVKAALERPGTLDMDISLAGIDFDTERERVEQTAFKEEWDLVLADLRTSTADHAGAPSRGAMQYAGADWIRQIKDKHPETAVVAFTASNKAWSVQELREQGIDDYWVKESPEFGIDDAYSQANAARLLTAVRKALKPRIEARPIWALRVDLVRLAENPEYRRGWIPRSGPARSELEVKGRLDAIVERLSRAYGFMVLSRSKHEEDRFAIRGRDLAFLTLWSVINEATELYFHGPQRKNRDDQLAKRADAEFSWRNPKGGKPQWETYWRIQNKRKERTSVPEQIAREQIRKKVCPRSNGKPDWPRGEAETPRIIWALNASSDAELVKRFLDLRHLRNKLEEEHGRAGNRREAELEDVHAMCDVWRALLVTPYDEDGSVLCHP